MDDHSCLEENRNLWDSVVASYVNRQDSIYGEVLNKNTELLNINNTLAAADQASEACLLPSKIESADENKNPASLQRDILALLKTADRQSSSTYDLPSQLVRALQESCQHPTDGIDAGHTGWCLAELAGQKSLLVREDVLKEACDRALHLHLETLMPALAALVVLPTVSQRLDPFSHPAVTTLCALVAQAPEACATAGLVPALKWSTSAQCPLLLAKIIKQMGATILPHVNLLMRALAERKTATEHHLEVIEAVCAIVGGKPQKVVIESMTTALSHTTSLLPSSSSRVGRTLLAVASKLAPHLHKEDPSFLALVQIVQTHESPLKRALEAQLKKVN